MISREKIERLFHIDADAGRLYWRQPPKNHSRLLLTEAGGPRANRSKRYWVIKIDKRAWKRSQLIFLAVHGRLPQPCVDHKDGDSLNDSQTNLREATVTENAWNHKRRSRRINLPMGVRLLAGSGRFQARISHNHRQIHLGAYDTPSEAAAVYQSKRKELFGEFA